MNRFRFFLMVVVLHFGCHSKEPLTITFTGDVILDGGVAQEMSIRGDSILMDAMQSYLRGDFNFINLETVLANIDGERREGGRLKNVPSLARALKTAGVHGASVANNHSFDYSISGYEQTIEALEKAGIDVLGNDCMPVKYAKHGSEFAVLAACLTTSNKHLCIKDQSALLHSLHRFRSNDSETSLIVYLHWGLEYQFEPQQWQKKFARRLIDDGVDAVIGHHPHVFQSFEYYNGKPIIYSLGNFVADAYLPATTEGMVANLEFVDSEFELSFVPVDLSSYFPVAFSQARARRFMCENLKFSSNMCFYMSGYQWFAQHIDSVDFSEDASEWIFTVDDQYGLLIRTLYEGGHAMAVLNNGVAEKPMMIHGILSEIEIADITNDGINEILLGIVKKVQFDQQSGKRVNIFRIVDRGVQTVWLGTRFIDDLVSFNVVSNKRSNYLETIEMNSPENTAVRVYHWDQFGFELIKQ